MDVLGKEGLIKQLSKRILEYALEAERERQIKCQIKKNVNLWQVYMNDKKEV